MAKRASSGSSSAPKGQVVDSESVGTEKVELVLEAKDDGKTEEWEAKVRVFFNNLTAMLTRLNQSGDQVFSSLQKHVDKLVNGSRISKELGQEIMNQQKAGLKQMYPDQAAKIDKAADEVQNRRNKGLKDELKDRKDLLEKDKEQLKNLQDLGRSFAMLAGSIYIAIKPFQKFVSHVEHLRQMNLQMEMLARGALTTAGALAASGTAVAAFGGSERDIASVRRNFEMEMEKRRVGMGNGGVFTQALARYGIDYDPRSFDNTMRKWVAFMSDPTKTDAQKQNAGAMLGLTQPMIAALMKGQGYWNSSLAEGRELTSNKNEATKASLELTEATSKLSMAWQNLKDGVFVHLAPLVEITARALTGLVKALNNPVFRGLAAIASVIVTLGSAYLGTKIAAATAKVSLHSLIKTLGLLTASSTAAGKAVAQNAAGNVAGSVAGKVGGAGLGSAAGAVGKLNAVSVIAGVADAVAGLVQRQVLIHNLSVTKEIVEKWHNEWFAFNAIKGGGLTRTGIDRFERELGISHALSVSARNQLQMDKTVAIAAVRATDGNAGSSVSVSNLTINVESPSANPTEVAQSVHEVILREFKVLAQDTGGVA